MLDKTSREGLLHEIERSLRDAFERRRNNAAAGDYSSDPRADRFNFAVDLRFKTVGRECGIDSIVLDKFAGHAPKSVSDGYGTVTLKTMREALDRMPRCEV